MKVDFGNYSINSGIIHKNNPDIEQERRISYAYLLATTPETFDTISENNICLFHGTNSTALCNILKYGLNSVDESKKRGIEVLTGEEISRFQGKRDFISLTDDIDVAMDYAEMKPSEKAGKGSFPVMLGISLEDAKKLKTIPINSDTREIGVLDNIPPEYISFICVPESKIEFVRKLVNNDKIKVCPFEPEKRFYEKTPYNIAIDDKKFEEVLHDQNPKDKIFNLSEIKSLTLGRIKSRVQASIMKMQNLLKYRSDKGKDAYERN